MPLRTGGVGCPLKSISHAFHTRVSLTRASRPQLIALVVLLIYAVLGYQFFSSRAPLAFGSFSASAVTLLGVITTITPWPLELPLVPDGNGTASGGGVGGTEVSQHLMYACFAGTSFHQLFSEIPLRSFCVRAGGVQMGDIDFGVVFYAFSFCIICLLILIQARQHTSVSDLWPLHLTYAYSGSNHWCRRKHQSLLEVMPVPLNMLESFVIVFARLG